MKTAHILLLCILGAALLSPVLCNSNAFNPDKCCFQYYPNKIRKSFFASYHKTHENCPMPGTILVTKKSVNLCADPRDPWVVTVTKYVDGLSR